jgi:hypothetical protein
VLTCISWANTAVVYPVLYALTAALALGKGNGQTAPVALRRSTLSLLRSLFFIRVIRVISNFLNSVNAMKNLSP